MANGPTIYIAGHQGMVGSAIIRKLNKIGIDTVLTAVRDDLDLLDQEQVNQFFQDHKVDQVYLAAAKVGGIHANNTYPAEFIRLMLIGCYFWDPLVSTLNMPYSRWPKTPCSRVHLSQPMNPMP